jgi:hypothetical protein
MKTNKDAMDAVLRGVKEVIDPAFTYKGHTEEWHYYIDLTTLDMFITFNCILAQLEPLLRSKAVEESEVLTPFEMATEELESKRDLDELVPRHATEFGTRVSWTTYFGFDSWFGVYTYDDLTNAWTYYIEGRRAEAA